MRAEHHTIYVHQPPEVQTRTCSIQFAWWRKTDNPGEKGGPPRTSRPVRGDSGADWRSVAVERSRESNSSTQTTLLNVFCISL